MIDDLHKKALEARQLRSERFAVRRQQDIQDELDECKGQLMSPQWLDLSTFSYYSPP